MSDGREDTGTVSGLAQAGVAAAVEPTVAAAVTAVAATSVAAVTVAPSGVTAVTTKRALEALDAPAGEEKEKEGHKQLPATSGTASVTPSVTAADPAVGQRARDHSDSRGLARGGLESAVPGLPALGAPPPQHHPVVQALGPLEPTEQTEPPIERTKPTEPAELTNMTPTKPTKRAGRMEPTASATESTKLTETTKLTEPTEPTKSMVTSAVRADRTGEDRQHVTSGRVGAAAAAAVGGGQAGLQVEVGEGVNGGDSLGMGEGGADDDSAVPGGWLSEPVREEVDPDVVAKAKADLEVQEFREKIRRRRQQQQQQQQQKHNPLGQQSPRAETSAARFAAPTPTRAPVPDGAGPTVLTAPTAGVGGGVGEGGEGGGSQIARVQQGLADRNGSDGGGGRRVDAGVGVGMSAPSEHSAGSTGDLETGGGQDSDRGNGDDDHGDQHYQNSLASDRRTIDAIGDRSGGSGGSGSGHRIRGDSESRSFDQGSARSGSSGGGGGVGSDSDSASSGGGGVSDGSENDWF